MYANNKQCRPTPAYRNTRTVTLRACDRCKDYCAEHEVRFIRGRLKFGGLKNSAPFPSAVVVMRPAARRSDRFLPPLGTEPEPRLANTGVERSLT